MTRHVPSRALVAVLAAGAALAPALVAAEEAAPRPPVELVAQNCGACHGREGRVFTESMPPLAGMDPADFVAAMRAFREDRRPATIMDRIAKAFDAADDRALADYYAALPPVPLTQEVRR